jgi:ABC-type protease/lipase transport system fused ATPase/permease subunit
LFGEPALVVLDEPNANLDHAGEQALYKSLLKLKERGCTILIVAHRPAALRTADKVLVLKEGCIAAFGERDKVLRALTHQPTAPRVAVARGPGPQSLPARLDGRLEG